QELEKNRQWRDAAALFEKDPSPAGREGKQRCLRHILQDRRHRERAFREAIIGLKKSGHVLEVYEKVLNILQTHYIELDRTAAGRLFEQGVLEFRFALEDPLFQKEYLANAQPDAIAALRARLVEWDGKGVNDNNAAREQLRKVAKLAYDTVRLPLTVVTFEFVCGACNSLDEYTAYLTPAQVNEMRALTRGRFAGVGIEPAVVDQKVVIGQMHPDSPAARSFKVGDRIVRVGRQPVDAAALADIRSRLRGEAGSFVEVEVQGANDMTARTVKLERQPYMMPSVEAKEEPRDGVGYARVLCFTDTTVSELQDAILRLQAAGMRALVLDLRGNPGGLFKSAIQTAAMCLP